MKRFPSIHKNEEFKQVYNLGKSRADSLLVMYVRENDLGSNRLGISASKKIGNSVTRHRMARLLREAFRHVNPGVTQGYDIVVVVRQNATTAGFDQICESFTKLCSRNLL